MPTIRELQAGLYEDVGGTIIGAVTFPYEFWERDGSLRIDRNFFENDEQAIEWFKERHPAAYKRGVEMRVFDQADK